MWHTGNTVPVRWSNTTAIAAHVAWEVPAIVSVLVVVLEHIPVWVVHTGVPVPWVLVGTVVGSIALVVVVVAVVPTVVPGVMVWPSVVLCVHVPSVVHIVGMSVPIEVVLLSLVAVVGVICAVLAPRDDTVRAFQTCVAAVVANADALPCLITHRVIGALHTVLWRWPGTAVAVQTLR